MSVRVAIRVRPLNATEAGPVAVTCADPRTIELRCPSAGGVSQIKRFSFELCAHDKFTQEDVFKATLPELLDSAASGMKVTILAYGATGSGKTHTVMGSRGDEGVIERAAAYLNRPMVASFYEVYADQVYDLLDTSKALPVRQNAKTFFASGLVELECLNVDDIAAVVAEGRKARRRASHKLNRDSSRGHAVLTVQLESGGKVSFVDLAGSERLGRSMSENVAETGAINRSLFALGKVISALSTGQKNHVPYRDSTLTKLLMDSLGGDVATLIIACVSPAPAHLDETLCTLQYAHRATGIQNSPNVSLVANGATTEDAPPEDVDALRREIAQLRDENRRLRGALQASGTPSTASTTWSRPTPPTDDRVDVLGSKLERLEAHFANLEAKLEEVTPMIQQQQPYSYAMPEPSYYSESPPPVVRYRDEAPLCGVRRQTTGDVVRRHRDGI